MRQLLMAVALSTSCLTLSSCAHEKVVAEHISIPPDRIDCAFTGQRPAVAPEYKIDWTKLQTVAQAKAEHDLYVKQQRAREAVIARYMVNVEGVLFACANDAEWLRNYEEDMEASHTHHDMEM